jgi:hypothetical protein
MKTESLLTVLGDTMEYQLIALSDSDPEWNDKVESWWNNGGALLWNQFGGAGAERLVLSQSELDAFLVKAKLIPGWNASPEHVSSSAYTLHPVVIQPYVESNAQKTGYHREVIPDRPTVCCRDCGRPIHPALLAVWDRRVVWTPRTEMNHLLNSLQEAIAFARGNGPNNQRIWADALDSFVEAMEALSRSQRDMDED